MTESSDARPICAIILRQKGRQEIAKCPVCFEEAVTDLTGTTRTYVNTTILSCTRGGSNDAASSAQVLIEERDFPSDDAPTGNGSGHTIDPSLDEMNGALGHMA